MIDRLLAFPRLELASYWKRPLPLFMYAILTLLSLGLVAGGVQVSAGSADTGGAKLAMNGGFNLAFVDVIIFAIVLPFFAAVACGMPLLVDGDRQIQKLLTATPLSWQEYAWSRFLAAMAVLAAVLAAWLACQIAIYESWPIDPTQRVRTTFSLVNYLGPLLWFALPMVVFTGGTSMWAGVRTRQPVLVFALPVVIVVAGIFFLWDFNPEWLPRWADRLMQAVEPTGFRWFYRTFLSEDRGVAFYNAARVVPDGLYVVSRFVLIGLGLAGVWATGRRLARSEHDDKHVGDGERLLAAARAAGPTTIDHAAIAARGALPAATIRIPGFLETSRAVLRQETWSLLKSPGLWLFGPLILVQTWAATTLSPGTLDTETLMTTGAAAAVARGALTLLLGLLILFYTVESLVREERVGLSGIHRACPVPTAGVLAGKVLANAVMALVIVGFTSLAIAVTLVVQRFQTGIVVPLEVPVLVMILGVLLVPTLVVWAAWVTFLHALVRNRFVTYALGVATLIVTGFLTRYGWLNWLTAWNLAGATVRWSELDRLGYMWPALVANRLTALALAAFLVAITLKLWPRRLPDLRATFDTLRPAAFARAALTPALVGLPLLALGIHTGTKVRAGYEGKPQTNAGKAYWRRNSNTWENVPAPALDRVEATVRLFPEKRRLEVIGKYRIRNPHRQPMHQIPLTVGSHFKTTSEWTVDGQAVDPATKDPPAPAIENRSGLFVVTPPRPLATGESVDVGFHLEGRFPDGWSKASGGAGEFVIESGVVLTSFSPSFLPVPGFIDAVGVDDKNRRDAREYPLDHWKTKVDPACGPAWSSDVRLSIEGPSNWVLNGCGVEESSEEIGDGRKRVVWKTEHPVRFFNIVGGPLRAAPGRRSTVYYDPRTEHNVPTMVRALDAARERYGAWFVEYPWTNLRVTEFPGLAGYAQGFPGNISFSENIGYLAKPLKVTDAATGREEGKIDAAFYIVAHEAGHQWWGNIVTPGKGPGGNIISEGLAEFSALMLVHHELGEEQGKTLRRRWEQTYVFGRRADNERPINRVDGSRPGDSVVTYQRAGWAFWMLRNLMGEEAMLAGLRDFIGRWRDGVETPEGLDFPLIEDLLESLRPHAPDPAAFDDFVGRWILGRDLPDLEIREARVTRTETGYRVTGQLANIGTGRADVKVRVEGKKPDTKDATCPAVDATVTVSADAPGSIEIETAFPPTRIVVDPDVELLFAGRKRAVATLAMP